MFGREVGALLKNNNKILRAFGHLKLQGNLQSSGELIGVPALSTAHSPGQVVPADTRFAACMHQRDLITQHKNNRIFMCRAETCVCGCG